MRKQSQDTFARAVGIRIDECDERAGIFDNLHRIEVERLKAKITELEEESDTDSRIIQKQWRRIDIWKLLAILGWGMFGIAAMFTHTPK